MVKRRMAGHIVRRSPGGARHSLPAGDALPDIAAFMPEGDRLLEAEEMISCYELCPWTASRYLAGT